MTRTTDPRTPSVAGLALAGQCWVEGFGIASLDPADAPDLVASAQKIAHAVARAARNLSWDTADSFDAVLRQAERSSDC